MVTPAETQACAYLAADLPADEGNVPYAYQDSLSYWTIGIGFLINKRAGGKPCRFILAEP